MCVALRRNAVFLFIACLLLASCSNPAGKLPKYDQVPHFQMTDSEGFAYDSRQLADKVWIADFIYTQCPGPCPLMSSKMHALADQLKNDPDVHFVSFSVDPAHDTPAVLNEYAHHFGGPSKQWVFLTGTPDTIHQVAFSAFHLGDIISKMDHSTRFALVDKSGTIRGYYESTSPDDLKKLIADTAVLR